MRARECLSRGFRGALRYIARGVAGGAAVLVLALPAAALAQVQVTDPWIRAPVAGQSVAGGYMRLHSSRDAALVEARASAAGAVEIHEMRMEGSVMRMRALAKLELPSGRTVELKPGGNHLMFTDLKQPLKAGETVRLTLVFEDKDGKREEVEVSAAVRPLGAGMEGASGAHKHH